MAGPDETLEIDGSDWPVFGWQTDVRPALADALERGVPCALATLVNVEGSAPRGPGTQMLFCEDRATGYFSGDCIEGDVARHAREIMASGTAQVLHYGAGSPWIDIRLRCGGALHVFVERIAPDCRAAARLIEAAQERRPVVWSSDGIVHTIEPGEGDPALSFSDAPLHLRRRYDPPLRAIVTGGDPGALALAKLAQDAGFETHLVRPGGPQSEPPFAVAGYHRTGTQEALATLGADRWTAYIGATHEDELDLPGVRAALEKGAGYVAMLGARSRSEERRETLLAGGIDPALLERLHLHPGIEGMGKSPWEVAIAVIAQAMQTLQQAGA